MNPQSSGTHHNKSPCVTPRLRCVSLRMTHVVYWDPGRLDGRPGYRNLASFASSTTERFALRRTRASSNLEDGADNRRDTNAELLVVQRHRRWTTINPTLAHYLGSVEDSWWWWTMEAMPFNHFLPGLRHDIEAKPCDTLCTKNDQLYSWISQANHAFYSWESCDVSFK